MDNNENKVHEEHPTFIGLFVEFALEIYDFFKFIFHDLWLGEQP